MGRHDGTVIVYRKCDAAFMDADQSCCTQPTAKCVGKTAPSGQMLNVLICKRLNADPPVKPIPCLFVARVYNVGFEAVNARELQEQLYRLAPRDALVNFQEVYFVAFAASGVALKEPAVFVPPHGK